MKNITLLIKPASDLCNMRCEYCFYKDVSAHRRQKESRVMSLDTARVLIEKAVDAVSIGGTIHFMFQGGEPMLAGLAFFQHFIEMENRYAGTGIKFTHSIQTNGLLLDAQWANFFAKHDFLVGISIDGDEILHDNFRRDAAGEGTYHRIIRGLKQLQSQGVQTNFLCVVTGQMAKKPQRIYRNLVALGRQPMQFIPCLDPLDEKRGAMAYSLTKEGYGKFLCGLFDCWYADWKRGNYVTIRNFEDHLRGLLRMPPASCSASGGCGHYLLVEGNGDLYPCDFYATEQWRMGNIRERSIEQALASEVSVRFVQAGAVRPKECADCIYMSLCRGGCKRDFDENGSNYYCAAYRVFFTYAIERLEEMAIHYLR